MRIDVKFTDVYDGAEHPRTVTLNVPLPPAGSDIEEWADDHLFPHTGDGNAINSTAGYYAEILDAPEAPFLNGREFDWFG